MSAMASGVADSVATPVPPDMDGEATPIPSRSNRNGDQPRSPAQAANRSKAGGSFEVRTRKPDEPSVTRASR